ncbi:TetR/AcrR family transcriptional regulator [uncultured Methanobrevibacter sp.]|uniref:TetR/AcrR family transcriptional regulator n=1 Tax=uncultured Methanobrevibacter sp. TaxID=253161 RepID=UPI0025F40E42|nr:TetR/AcrR family transcriptional regulator [uncultured Methanobrevibacter sp.]
MLFEKENTEEKIITATFNIVQREGVQKATTKKIAAEAGVNEVTIFRKFENKKNLIEATKDYYMTKLLSRLEETFDYDEDESIEDYLKHCFHGILDFSQEDISIIRVAMQEIKGETDKKLLISHITDTIINKMEEFFKLQLEKVVIKNVNSKAISVMCFSIIFQSTILWQIYGNNADIDSDIFADDYLDIIFNGIKP